MATPLSVADLSDMVSELVRISTDNPFQIRDTEYRQRRDLLYGRRPVVIPGIDLKVQYRDPAIEDNCHQFKNRMLAAPIKINVASLSPADRAVEKAQRMEALFYRAYFKWRARGIFDKGLFDMASIGLGVWYLSLNRDLLPELPAWEKGEDDEAYIKRCEPELTKFIENEQDIFSLEPIDPATFYYTQSMDYRFQRAKVPIDSLNRDYESRGKQVVKDADVYSVRTITPGTNLTNGTTTRWNETVDFFTISCPDFIYHCIGTGDYKDGQKLDQLEVYPNILSAPAFGYAAGEITGDSEPLYAFRPLVAPLYALTPYKNLATTAKLCAGLDAAQQRYALEKIDPTIPDSEGAVLEVRTDENGVLIAPDGYRIVNPGLSIGPDLNDAIAFIEREGQKYGYPKVLGRPEEVTASSGYERAQQQDAVANLLDPPLEHFAAMLHSWLFPAMAQGTKKLGVPVTVKNVKAKSQYSKPQNVQDSVTINPNDIMDADISVSFSSVTQFSRIAQQEEGIKLMQAKQLNQTQFQEEIMGIDDIEAWREQSDIDAARTFGSERAITDAEQAIARLSGAVNQLAIQGAGVDPITANSDLLRPDRDPSIPTGTGQAMPIAPTPGGMGESAAPGVPAGAV